MSFQEEIATEMKNAIQRRISQVESKIETLRREKADLVSETADHRLEEYILDNIPFQVGMEDKQTRRDETRARIQSARKKYEVAEYKLVQAEAELSIYKEIKGKIESNTLEPSYYTY